MDMVQKVRPQQEVQLMRDNILIQRMRKLKDKEMPMSVRSFIPERYNRYETMRDTNRQIKETTEKLDRIKLQSSKMLEKIKNLSEWLAGPLICIVALQLISLPPPSSRHHKGQDTEMHRGRGGQEEPPGGQTDDAVD